jgi:glycosyltransferase involved in cell wall biosynthesis
MPTSAPQRDARPGLAFIANCLTPYRVQLHQLIAAGIPELKLHSLITHDDADFKWALKPPDAIHLKHFGASGDSPTAGSLHAPRREWRKGGRIIRYLHESDVRAVICLGYRYLSFLRVIGHCYRHNIPVFVNSDSNIRSEGSIPGWKSWSKRQVYAWWLHRVTGTMPMGKLGEDFFLKYGADPGRFYRVPYTPDYDAFATPDLDGLQRFRQRYGLSEHRRIILYSGRLAPVKRVDLLIQATIQIAAERPEWDLVIAGDGPLAPSLRKLAEPLGARVHWTGFLEQEELKFAYQASDVLALISDREPWAVVVQEAMAAGLAIVATDVVGAAHELVTDGVAGRIVPAGCVSALRAALLDVTDAEEIDGYRKRARQALQQWRAKVDPVAEIRRALVDANVLRM